MPSADYAVVQKISRIIGETPDYREGLRLAVQCIAERVSADACSLLVLDAANQRLVMAGTYGLEQETVGSIQLRTDQGVTGFCFRTNRIVNVADKRQHPEYCRFDSSRADDYKALLAVPLVVSGCTIGVMDLERRRRQAFSHRAVELVQAIASPLAVFIQHARLASENVHGSESRERSLLSDEVLKGKALTEGLGKGIAHFVAGVEVFDEITLEYAEDRESEAALLTRAFELAREETRQIEEDATEVLAEADAGIFAVHLMLLDDPTLHQRLNHALDQRFSARFALKMTLQEFEREMGRLDDGFMRERLADVQDVIMRLLLALERLRGCSSHSVRRPSSREPVVVVAHELLPSQLMRIPMGRLAAIVCDEGGATSHAAILARALRIPMLVGVKGARQHIRSGDEILVDCGAGNCYVRPSASLVRRFRVPLAHFTARREEGEVVETSSGKTRDGVDIRLGANISLISELPLLSRYGAMGIGLYRTEFMFMVRASYPTEEEQFNVFRRVVAAGGSASVTVRVIDVGGDKPLPYVEFGAEDNPFLGWRGIRFLLSRPEYFAPHLRAILRTTVHGRVNVLLPMVADLDELLQAKEMLNEARESLLQDGVVIREFRLGIMLEVPSAVWALPSMLPHIDFVSIGTNDLAQYTLAVDRGNRRVTRWYRQLHPVILRIIQDTCRLVHSLPGKSISICGEMAGHPLAIPFLIGAGMRYLSMSPWNIPLARRVISALDVPSCERLAEKAVGCTLDGDVLRLMEAFAKEYGLPSGDDRQQDADE